MMTVNFCNVCGNRVSYLVPAGDNLPRHVCDHCGHVHYFNPRVIVGCIAEWEDGRILMCKRNIAPRLGLWTFPAGFMELGETTAVGAARETAEEALADVVVEGLLAVINVPYVSQVYVVHRGRMRTPDCGPTPESSEVRLMREDEVPWQQMSFPTMTRSLEFYFADRAAGRWDVHTLDLIIKADDPRLREVSTGEPLPSRP